MALHLNGLKAKQGLMDLRDIKTKKCDLRAHYMSNLVFEGERKEKREKIWGLQGGVALVDFAFRFLLL